MRQIIYYVATSLDGYISGLGGNVELFASKGNGVQRYMDDLKSFDTVIMGRNTYEAGYQYGLESGMAPYPHMENYIVSNSISFENQSKNLHVIPLSKEKILELKNGEGSPIYLCGGGMLAGWMLENNLIDQLKIKLNPFIQGDGVRLFGNSDKTVPASFIDASSYDEGLQFLKYTI